ncbi:MAG: diaminopimelate decarboxylase [Chloroflexi bacterium]|nr:diaminopimelate decarboxylase [Chloroflexota bacterium]
MRGLDTLPVFPMSAFVNDGGRLSIGGNDVAELARVHGTPLYVYDEETLRTTARAFRSAFQSRYRRTTVVYACKAFANVGLVRLLAEEGLGFDVVSGGEIAVIEAADVGRNDVYFHGNNKSAEELEYATRSGVGRIVVDNLHELDLLEGVLHRLDARQDVLIRITPGVDPHTHAHTTTGLLDSKFGLPVTTGQAEEVVARALRSTRINLIGLHFHLGSPIFEREPYRDAIGIALDFAADMKAKYGFIMREFSPGGGFAARYLITDDAPAPDAYAEVICRTLEDGCLRRGLELPAMTIEPGRAIVARAGVAVYTVGAIKEVPGVRTYVAVDGGMGDNIRPALYGSRYEAALVTRMAESSVGPVTVAGKYCESGDILVRDYDLPQVRSGDLIALPAAGAYCLAMSSHYNANPNPEVVLVGDGSARLLRRRETYRDLLAADVV